MRFIRVTRREMRVSFALSAVLLCGCPEAASEVDAEFSLARAAAAVAFAEAEVSLSSHAEAPQIEESASAVTPARRRRVLYFTAAWCPACRANAATLAALAAAGWSVGTSEGDHIQIVDVDTSASLATTYKVDAVPQWVLIEDGVAVHRASGVLDPFAVGRLFARDE